MSSHSEFRPENTVYVGNLNEKVTERLLYELFVQAGPIEVVTIPKSKEGQSRCFGFVEFKENVSVEYACELMHGIQLFHSSLVVRPQNTDRNSRSTNTPRATYNDQRHHPYAESNHPSNRPNYPINRGGGHFSRGYAPQQSPYPHPHSNPHSNTYSNPHPYHNYNDNYNNNNYNYNNSYDYSEQNYSQPPYNDYHPQRSYNGRKRKHYND